MTQVAYNIYYLWTEQIEKVLKQYIIMNNKGRSRSWFFTFFVFLSNTQNAICHNCKLTKQPGHNPKPNPEKLIQNKKQKNLQFKTELPNHLLIHSNAFWTCFTWVKSNSFFCTVQCKNIILADFCSDARDGQPVSRAIEHILCNVVFYNLYQVIWRFIFLHYILQVIVLWNQDIKNLGTTLKSQFCSRNKLVLYG